MNESIRPDRKFLDDEYDQGMVRICTIWFKEICKAMGWEPGAISTITELGCGRGLVTEALLNAFPEAQVYAVDCHEILRSNIKDNERLIFKKGLIVDLLAAEVVPASDIVILKDVTSSHGLNTANINFLEDLVGTGFLITAGINIAPTDEFESEWSSWLEDQPWFLGRFEPVSIKFPDGFKGFSELTRLWRVKEV